MTFTGKLAEIDLTSGTVEQKEIPSELRKKFLGGRGLDAYFRYHYTPPSCDPLGPHNPLIFAAGLLGGMLATACGRTDVAAKSPLTGFVGSANMGGYFAPELRFAGFDHLIIRGKAQRPSYLWIHDGIIDVRDAASIWGKGVFDTQEAIREELHDPNVQIACIGPAGEKLVRFATIMSGLKSAAGRSGMGAVMGSKNLKAIAVRGTKGIPIAHPREALDYNREIIEKVTSTKVSRIMGKWGTMFILGGTNTIGLVRTNNFGLNLLEGEQTLEAENMDDVRVGHNGCFGCQVHCRQRYVIKEGAYKDTYGMGPEHTSQGSFGTMVGCRNLNTVLICNHLVNDYGIDTVETGNMIAWAMDLFERGILTKGDTDGLALRFGNDEAVIEMVHRIAGRVGLGRLLGEGGLPAAEQIGHGSGKFLIHVKGMCNLHTDERPTPALALGIATSSRGSDHMRSRPAIDVYNLPLSVLNRVYRDNPCPYNGRLNSRSSSYTGKAWMVMWHEHVYMAVDCLGICRFHTVFLSPNHPSFSEFTKLVRLNTGLEMTPMEMWDAADRGYTLERLFNIREGLTRADDTLVDRYFDERTPLGLPAARGKKLSRGRFKKMLDEYYRLHDWDNEGVPEPRLLRRLGIGAG